MLENDLLEALVALPEQLFYNTGIATYIWVLTNRKAPERKGKVALIDATGFWEPMRKSLGDKRRQIPREKADEILRLLEMFDESEHVKIFPTTEFGFRKIRVEQPLRLNFLASEERIALLEEESSFQNMAKSKKKNPEKKHQEQEEGRILQKQILDMLRGMPDSTYSDREVFRKELKTATKEAGLKLAAPVRKAIESALSEQDETAEICRDSKGTAEPDSDLRDHENVPLGEDVTEYFEREVTPHVADAWIDESYTDERDGEVGRVGYEINFNRYFYEYQPPRPLEEITADIRKVEKEIVQLLGELTDGF